MRVRMLVSTMVMIAVGLAPSLAHANGGAYIMFEGTHHMPGDRVTGEVYVSVPRAHRDLLDRGPFYAYMLPGGPFIEEGRPVPTGAIPLGTFVVHRDGRETELTVSFTVPEVEGGFYQVGMCNDPCTVSGFGETVSGTVSVVATAREATLLADNGKLHARLAGLKRDLRKAERIADDRVSLAAADLEESETSRSSLADRVDVLEAQLSRARSAGDRPMIDPWWAAAIAVALLASAASLTVRRRPSSTGSDVGEGSMAEGV